MAVHKAIRSNPVAQPQPSQPQPQHPQPSRAEGTEPERPRHSRHQLKAEILDVLRHLNRGFGVALTALDKLEAKDRLKTAEHPQSREAARVFPRVFPKDCLRDYRNRTEALRAQANHALLQLLAGHEERDAAHFGRDAIPKTTKHRS